MDTGPGADPWEGLTERYNPRTRRTEWVEWSPQACPAGHATLTTTWRPCADCGFVARHWTCTTKGCDGEVRHPRHVCASQGKVDPRRR